MTNFKEA